MSTTLRHFRLFAFLLGSCMLGHAGCEPQFPTTCPNDPPAATCQPNETCCKEAQALRSCKAKLGVLACNADGKTDSKLLSERCPNEAAAATACVLGGGLTCDAFAAKSISFNGSPKSLSESAQDTGSVTLVGVPEALTVTVMCQLNQTDGSVRPDGCRVSGIPASDISYGPLPLGVYQLHATVSMPGCTPRVIDSESFTVRP